MATCTSCQGAIPPEARFCPSCGARAPAGCGACGAPMPEGARFCPSCGTPAPAAAPSPSPLRERKVVTVLFADVTGSTALAGRLDPERLREVLDAYFAAAREEIESRGGTVEKFVGDAVMAVFGVPAAHEDDPSRALRAGLAILDRLASVNRGLRESHGVALEVRVGVNTGDVLATAGAAPGEAMVTGDVVNVAARLQAEAAGDTVLAADRSARAARDLRFGPPRTLRLRGKEGDVVARQVLDDAHAGGAPATPGTPGGLSAPLVGRDREMELLRSLHARAADEGRPALVTIYGDPGVGKSRLVREFLAWAEARPDPPRVLRGRCLPYGEGVTYWPLAEILKEHAGVHDSDPADVVLARIEEACDGPLAGIPGVDAAAARQMLAYTVGAEYPDAPMTGRDPRQIRTDIRAAWRAFLSALARERSLVVVVEDIHWADDDLLGLVDDVAERAEGGLLVVCPARPVLLDRRPDWGGGRRNASAVALDPLPPAGAEDLVSGLLPGADLPEGLTGRILARAEGNPFFIEEIVRHLVEEGVLVDGGGAWRVAEDVGEVEIPDSVQGVLAARIDLLAPADKHALQLAAVVGRVFWPSPVALLRGADDGDIRDVLRRLEERDLVRQRVGSTLEGEPELIFKHVLTRDVAYASLTRRERARAHAVVADWIAGQAAAGWQEMSEILAHHRLEAYLAERDDPGRDPAHVEGQRRAAIELLLTASRALGRRFALGRARALAGRALDISASPAEIARVRERLGSIALKDYRGDEAWAHFRSAVEARLAGTPGDGRAIANACVRAVEIPLRWPGSMHALPGNAEVLQLLDTGFAHVGAGDVAERVRLLTARSFAPFSADGRRERVSETQMDAAVADALAAAELADGIGNARLMSAALDGAASALAARGRYGQGVEVMRRRVTLLDRIEDPIERGDTHACLAWAHAMVGDYAAARASADLGILLAELGADSVAMHSGAWGALAALLAGDWDDLAGRIVPFVRDALGDRRAAPPYFTNHAHGAGALVHVMRGQRSEAEPLIAALAALEFQTDDQPVAATRCWQAWIATREGRHGDAADLLASLEGRSDAASGVLPFVVGAEAIAANGRWDDVAAAVAAGRDYARDGMLRALPVHMDLLEGRHALAEDRTEEAAEVLGAAAADFDALGAGWHGACARLDLAAALGRVGRRDDARAALASAAAALPSLRALEETRRAEELAAEIG